MERWMSLHCLAVAYCHGAPGFPRTPDLLLVPPAPDFPDNFAQFSEGFTECRKWPALLNKDVEERRVLERK